MLAVVTITITTIIVVIQTNSIQNIGTSQPVVAKTLRQGLDRQDSLPIAIRPCLTMGKMTYFTFPAPKLLLPFSYWMPTRGLTEEGLV